VLALQGRQDADHQDARADVVGLVLGRVEAGPHALLEVDQAAGAQLARRDVDLDVELAELGLEQRVGDRVQHLGVLHRRIAGVVDEVELDLQPGHRTFAVEPRLGQHPGEGVQTAAHLLAEPLPVLPGEDGGLDVLAHRALLPAAPC
jgi:hypothetical protein